MRAEVMQKLIGKQVKDVYGRFIGSVVGLSFDTSGHLKSVGVDHGCGDFYEYPGTRIIFDNETLIIVPRWKIDTERLNREISLAQRRAEALEELLKEGEVAQGTYEELRKQYGERIRQLQESYSTLTEDLKRRVEELDERDCELEKFLGSIKVQFRTGEIDDEAFRVASGHIDSMLQKDERERADIVAILESLGVQEEPSPSYEEEPEQIQAVPR